MPDRIAIKLLTESDVTFFEAQFRRRANIRQKAINLNANVFIGQLFPALGAGGVGSEIPLSLTILGPGKAGPYRLARSITKSGEGYKNWRLNGEFIRDPDLEPGRFDSIAAGDVTVMEFIGDPVPSAMTLAIVSASSDGALLAGLRATIPGSRHTMVQISRSDLGGMVNVAGVAPDHPIRLMLRDEELEAALEEAAFGGAPAVARLKQRHGRPTTAEDLAKARINAELIGADGEALLCIHLEIAKREKRILDARWVSKSDAASSWDFEVTHRRSVEARVDAKSTKGPFGRKFHMSGAEVAAAADHPTRYDLARIYEVNDDGAKVRFATDIRSLAQAISEAAAKLPHGVVPDSFTIDPQMLVWGDEEVIVRPDQPEDN